MAHKRSSKKTSFGKKSDAEKSFHKKRTARTSGSDFEKKPKKSFGRFSKYSPISASDGNPEKHSYDKEEKRFSKKKPVPFKREDFVKNPPGKSGGTSKKFKRARPEEENEKRFKHKRPTPRFDKREKTAFSRGKFSPSFSSGKRSFVKKSTNPSSHPEKVKKDDDLIRLNKYIANSGMGSRREADEMIKMGLISVNGVTITEMGHKVKQGDIVRHENKLLKAEKPVYILLNKPKGFITTTADPRDRKTVMNLVSKACKERIYPVGRLDRNTTGLLLLTNDGDLAEKLMHPSYNTKKIYKVDLDKPIAKNDLLKIQEGVRLEEGKALVNDVAVLSDDKKSIGLEIHIGWNRVVRRIFESLDYEVVKLDRVIYAGLDKKKLPRGEWRFLKSEEVVRLKHFK